MLKRHCKDPKAAADVFMMPHDQIGQMAEAGLIYPNTKYEKEVKENNIDSAVAGVTWKDKVYAYPYAVESQVLYYNKDTYSPEEIKTWKSLTEKAKSVPILAKMAQIISSALYL